MLSKSDYKKICKQLNLFGFKSYKEFLESNLWKEFRNILYKERRPTHCSICEKKDTIFFLHHDTYKRLLDPICVRFVCKKCHKKIHKNIQETIQDETVRLLKELNKTKQSKRIGSLRIIYSSNLPETLHHSLHASGVIDKVRQGEDILECVKDYYDKKTRRKDVLMLELLEEYYEIVMEYLGTFTTN